MVTAYRQAIQRVYDDVRKALRVIDTTDESLETVATQKVTVSTAVLTIASFFQLTGDEKKATFHLLSGGPINFNSTVQEVTAGGAEGSEQAAAGESLVVTGLADITNLRMVRATGGSDGIIVASLERRE